MVGSFYKMFPDEHFAIVKFKPGCFTFDESKRLNTEYKLDKDYSKIHYLLIILNNCVPEFSKEQLTALSEIYSYAPQENNHICTAWIVDEPIATAFAHIFTKATPELSHYCSTIERAFCLMGIPFSYDRFMEFVSEVNID